MTHAHFYLSASAWEPGQLRLTGDEARHCAQVTRHRAGDLVVVFDGVGRKAEARIEVLGKTEVLLTTLKTWSVPMPARPMTLVQAVTKGETFDWILEKAVELGVQRIVPVLSERSIVRLDAGEATKKHQKWQRLVLESCKQCGQAWLPELTMPCSMAAALELVGVAETKLVASLDPQAQTLRPLLKAWPAGVSASARVAVAIGPEGDFSESEHQKFIGAGWLPWSLGGLVLRSETAAVCALSILSYELNS